MPQVMVVARNFMDMVAALPAAKLDMLYDSAFICEAVLRSFLPLAKKYVLQMLYVSVPVPSAAIEEWVLDEYASKHKVAIDRLVQLRVFVEIRDRRKEVSYKMNIKFQGNMQKYLVSGLPRQPIPSSITGRLPTLTELENYALEQWECFLLQLINSSQVEKGTSFSSSMMRTFQRGLLSSRDNEAPKLSENGFQFLLMETNAQLWYIMREYISSAEERGVDPTELISFLLELSFHTLGDAYSLNSLADVQRIAIRDLAELGLVKLQQGRKDSWFIPTKLATNLSSSLSDASASKEGIVVVETNFRLYAYSASRLHCEILRLFSRVEYQLPNLIVGAITKESLYGAFDNGITAEQIVAFLQQNAHPRVADKIPIVQENVTDQTNPVSYFETEGVIYKTANSPLQIRVEYQLPNLIVGAITKESVYGAFDNGITAEQIVAFLQQNAHPRVADKIPIVPENVTDQIRLWENDRNRVEMVLSHVYEEFPSKDMFEQCCDHARDNGFLLWEDAKKMRLIVRGEFHQEMHEFLRRQR